MRGLQRAIGVGFVAFLFAGWVLGPALIQPGTIMIGDWVHPDNLSNHWLLVWVAEQLSQGLGILHNDQYYWPIGDAPVLAGNGNEGFLYLPFHLIFGWPDAVVPYLFVVFCINGIGGWVLARACGASFPSSFLVLASTTVAPFTLQECSSGRFSQVSIGWLLLFLGAWFSLLRVSGSDNEACHATIKRHAMLAGILLAITAFFYWYYGFFGVMAAAISLLVHGKSRPAWRTLMTFGLTFAIAIGPWAIIFIAHWAQVPGSHEVEQFPHPQAMRDVAPPTLPFLISNGRFLGHAIATTTWALGLMGVIVCLTKFRQDRVRLSLLLIWLFFFLLALGPLFPGAPYNWVYRWNPPLRRFWWPVRHVVVSNAMWAVMAALAIDYILSRRPRALILTAALASSLTIPILHAQGSPTSIRISAVNTPEKGYGWLATAPAGVVVSPPLAPKAGSQQLAMAFQIFHGKPLLAGHALWVDRVRPAQWDEFVAKNSFLTALQSLELGELPIHASPALATDGEVLLSFAPDDLQSLLDQGVRWFVIDRSQFTLDLQPVVKQYRLLFAELFGQSVENDEGVRFYDGKSWNGKSRVVLPEWRWPETLQPGGPEMPLLGRYPNSPVFDSIGTDTQTATW